jgi:uncharacterized membrane protein YcaP (DUF421 family)
MPFTPERPLHADRIDLAILEAKGAISVLRKDEECRSL